MGLLEGDLEKVPENLTVEDCYKRIYKWHQKYGEQKLEHVYKKDDEYSNAYLALLKELPPSEEVSSDCEDFVFSQVISMLMEWSYHQEDESGIKMGAYAHFAANKKYNDYREIQKRSKKCELYDKFGEPEKWKNL